MQAALCSIRIIRKVPDLAENFVNPAASLLKEKHHGVMITGVQLCTELCKHSSEALEYFRKVFYGAFIGSHIHVCMIYPCPPDLGD